MGGFDKEPLRLPKFALECFILVKVCHQLAIVTMKFLPEDQKDRLFLVRIGNLSCKNLEDVVNVGIDLCAFDIKFYRVGQGFDNKGFA